MHIDIIHCETLTFGPAFVEFHARQRACYAAFGAAAAAPAVLPAPERAVLIAARTEGGDMIAGIRLQRRTAQAPLALELVAARFGIQIPIPGGEVAEAGGLWAAEPLRGTGIGRVLMEALLAVAPFLRIDTVMVLAHQFHRFLRPAGFVPVAEVPRMIYPDDRYISEVQACEPLHARQAAAGRRDIMTSMRRAWAEDGFLRCDAIEIPEITTEQSAP